MLDLENLIYGTGGRPREVLRRVAGLVAGLGEAVHQVGCGNRWLVAGLSGTAADLGIRVFGGSMGADRADRELLARLRRDVPASCDTVVIGSGDRIFTAEVAAQRALGRRVIVVGVPGKTSAALRAVADLYLPLEVADPNAWTTYRTTIAGDALRQRPARTWTRGANVPRPAPHPI